MNECRASHSLPPSRRPTHPPHTIRIASSLTSTPRPRARRVVPARPDTTTARRPRIVDDSRIRIAVAVVVVDIVIAIEEHARARTTRNETHARTNASTRIARVRHSRRAHACIHYIRARISIHPRGRTTLTDHDSPPRDSPPAARSRSVSRLISRAIVISGRGCRFDESRPIVESPRRPRSSRRSIAGMPQCPRMVHRS